jgi:hypothetical protein
MPDGCPHATPGSTRGAGDRARHEGTPGAAAMHGTRLGTRPRARPHSAKVYSAFSAVIQANSTPGASRRRPRLYLRCRAPCAAHDSLCGGERAPPAPPSLGLSGPWCGRRGRGPPTRPGLRASRAVDANGRAVIKYQPDGLRAELVIKLRAWSALVAVRHSGHRIRLSEDVRSDQAHCRPPVR